MKHIALCAAVVAGASLPLLGTTAASGVMPPPAAVLLRVGTYNIRTSSMDQGKPNAWEERRDDVLALIRKLDLDAFGLQEVRPSQARFLRDGLPEYDMVGDFRDASRQTGEASPVFYRKERFSAGESGTFWLSETPDVPGSKSWDTACVRICTWVRLTDKTTGRTFCFANTHTDHRSELARTEGMKLIMRRMREFAPDGMPVVFTGDHNCGEWEESAKIATAVLRDTVHATETPPVGPYRTYNGFKWRENPPAAEVVKRPVEKRYGRGDYIYVSKGVRVKSHVCHADTRPGTKLYPSDHFPLSATIEFNGAVFGAADDNCWPKVIFPGDYPDPAVMRDGHDFYLTWSGGDLRPGLIVYHSRDLIHWTPLSCAAQTVANPIWAPEIAKIGGTYSIYFSAKGDFDSPGKWNVYRVTASEMKGPWSAPELVIANAGIDPGVARDDDGTVWLWLHHGKRVKLDKTGAKAIGAVEGGRYKGWRFPEEWRPGTKNLTLESPKLFKRGGWWYMVSAEGGTGMPLTAHMAIVARSKSPAGPWENSPYNPLVRAKSASEKWWCTGHATLFDDAHGNWWAVYHGYRNSFMTLGRSVLLAPIAWTEDGWPVLDRSGRAPLPSEGSSVVGGDYDDDFTGDSLSLVWHTFGNDGFGKARVADGSLRLVAGEGVSTSGKGAFPGAVLLFKPSAERYTASVDVKTDEDVRSGLVLFYDRGNYVGVTTDGRDFILRFPDGTGRREPNPFGRHVAFNLENNANRLSLYAEDASGRRIRLMNGIDVSQMHHGKGKCKNFRALHIGLVAEGRGEVSFGSFRYRVIPLPKSACKGAEVSGGVRSGRESATCAKPCASCSADSDAAFFFAAGVAAGNTR